MSDPEKRALQPQQGHMPSFVGEYSGRPIEVPEAERAEVARRFDILLDKVLRRYGVDPDSDARKYCNLDYRMDGLVALSGTADKAANTQKEPDADIANRVIGTVRIGYSHDEWVSYPKSADGVVHRNDGDQAKEFRMRTGSLPSTSELPPLSLGELTELADFMAEPTWELRSTS